MIPAALPDAVRTSGEFLVRCQNRTVGGVTTSVIG